MKLKFLTQARWSRILGGATILAFFFFSILSSTELFLNSPDPTISLPSEPQFSQKKEALSSTGAEDKTRREKARICKDIYSLVCSKRGSRRDPTGIVRSNLEGEQLAANLYQKLLELHPDWESEQIDQKFIEQVYTQKVRNRVGSAYQWVQATLIKMIERQPERIFTAQEKEQLKLRLMRTALDLPTSESPYLDEPDLLTKSDAFYESLANHQMRLRIGGAYPLSVTSWFNLVFTIAHELAHSIDPCEVRLVHLSYPAYDRLGACFMRQGLIATRQDRSECVHQDQLSETFADWMAVQVSVEALHQFGTEFKGPQLLSAVINSVNDLCEEDTSLYEENIDFHPPARVRINQIFGKNPKIRKILGCELETPSNSQSSKKYCTF